MVYDRFRKQVEKMDQTTRDFIDSSFEKLRSAEGAFDLLQSFKNLQSRTQGRPTSKASLWGGVHTLRWGVATFLRFPGPTCVPVFTKKKIIT